MNLNGKVTLQIASVSNWANVSSPYLGNLGYQPTSWAWTDLTEGLLTADISRGITEYEGPWSQSDVGQLVVKSRNPQMDPQNNPNVVAFGHKIRILVNNKPVFTGKIREVTVDYSDPNSPQTTTVTAFDAWANLADVKIPNTELATGNDSVEDSNIIPISLPDIFRNNGYGPVYVWEVPATYYDTGTGTWVPNTQGLYGQWASYTHTYKGYTTSSDPLAYGATTITNQWNPNVYLDPFDFKTWGNTFFQRFPHRSLHQLTISDTTPYGDVYSDNSAYDSEKYSIRHYNWIDRYKDGISDSTHPLYTNDDANPPIKYFASDTPYYGSAEVRGPGNAGWVACVTTDSTSLIDTVRACDQAEQGFIYVDKKDNWFILNRRMARNAPRPTRFWFNSANSTDTAFTSYKNLRVRDGISNIINKVKIVNSISPVPTVAGAPITQPDSSTVLYQNKDYLDYQTGLPIEDTAVVGSAFKGYRGANGSIALQDLETQEFTYENATSIQRYGERSIEVNTNYAWPLEDGTSAINFVETYSLYGNTYRPDDPTSTGNATTLWRRWKVDTDPSSSTTLRRRIYDASNMTTLYRTDSLYKNINARADELAGYLLKPTPQREVQSISFSPTNTADIDRAADTEIFDKVIINHSNQGVTFNKTYRVVGMTQQITLTSWDITYELWNMVGQP